MIARAINTDIWKIAGWLQQTEKSGGLIDERGKQIRQILRAAR